MVTFKGVAAVDEEWRRVVARPRHCTTGALLGPGALEAAAAAASSSTPRTTSRRYSSLMASSFLCQVLAALSRLSDCGLAGVGPPAAAAGSPLAAVHQLPEGWCRRPRWPRYWWSVRLCGDTESLSDEAVNLSMERNLLFQAHSSPWGSSVQGDVLVCHEGCTGKLDGGTERFSEESAEDSGKILDHLQPRLGDQQSSAPWGCRILLSPCTMEL